MDIATTKADDAWEVIFSIGEATPADVNVSGSVLSTLSSNSIPVDLKAEEKTPHRLVQRVNTGTQTVKRTLASVSASGRDPFLEVRKHSRIPWLHIFDPWLIGFHNDDKLLQYRLFDSSGIVTAVPQKYALFRDKYFIDLFFQKRFFSGRKGLDDNPDPEALLQSWNKFIERMVGESGLVIKKIKAMKKNFCEKTLTGAMIKVHMQSMKENAPCCVSRDQNCPMCYKGAQKYPFFKRVKMEDNDKSAKLKMLISNLDILWRLGAQERRDEEMKEDADTMLISDDYFDRIEALRIKQNLCAVQMEAVSLKRENQEIRTTLRRVIADNEQLHRSVKDLQDAVKDLSRR